MPKKPSEHPSEQKNNDKYSQQSSVGGQSRQFSAQKAAKTAATAQKPNLGMTGSGQHGLEQPSEKPSSPEQQLLLQIEKLRRQQSNTLQLYVEVAQLLFFEHDIIPTTNRMYQLVRRGSMGTPAQALKIFWAQLRDEAQVRMQKASLPPEVIRQAEQLLAQLWDEAVAHSNEHLHKDRLHLQTQAHVWQEQLQALRDNKQKLEADRRHLLQELTNREQALATSNQQQADLAQALQQSQLKQAQTVSRYEEKEKQWHQERVQLLGQLEAANEQATLAEERAQDHEKRALWEIEQARQETRAIIEKLSNDNEQQRLQLKEIKVIHGLQEKQLKQAEQQQIQLQDELNQKQKQLQQAEQQQISLKAKLKQAQEQLKHSQAQQALSTTEQQKLRRQIRRLEQRLQRRRRQSTANRRNR